MIGSVRVSTKPPALPAYTFEVSAEPSGSPGASPGTGGARTEPRPPARDELWIPIVLLVLVVLVAEYLVYQRDAVSRLWRGATARLGRGGTG